MARNKKSWEPDPREQSKKAKEELRNKLKGVKTPSVTPVIKGDFRKGVLTFIGDEKPQPFTPFNGGGYIQWRDTKHGKEYSVDGINWYAEGTNPFYQKARQMGKSWSIEQLKAIMETQKGDVGANLFYDEYGIADIDKVDKRTPTEVWADEWARKTLQKIK